MKRLKFQCRYCFDVLNVGSHRYEMKSIQPFQTNSKKQFLEHIRTCKHKGIKLE